MSYGAENIVRKQNLVIKHLVAHNITCVERARVLEELPFFENGKLKYKRTFNNLVKQSVIKQIGDKYYLDVKESKRFKKGFKRFFII